VKLGLALLRMIVGGLFVGHGLQKLAGRFGGNGLQATGEAFEGMGMRPGPAHAGAAGAAETAGGAMLAAGLFTPAASGLLSAVMLTAIRKVHGPKGPWVTDGGYEYNLVLLATVFALTDIGPGPLSLDALIGSRRSGLPWALAQLAAGAAGSAAAIELGARWPSREGAAPAEHAEQPESRAATQAADGAMREPEPAAV
jgi:putative oxidoreductase